MWTVVAVSKVYPQGMSVVSFSLVAGIFRGADQHRWVVVTLKLGRFSVWVVILRPSDVDAPFVLAAERVMVRSPGVFRMRSAIIQQQVMLTNVPHPRPV